MSVVVTLGGDTPEEEAVACDRVANSVHLFVPGTLDCNTVVAIAGRVAAHKRRATRQARQPGLWFTPCRSPSATRAVGRSRQASCPPRPVPRSGSPAKPLRGRGHAAPRRGESFARPGLAPRDGPAEEP